MKVLVLGAGNVGRTVALDLRDEFEVYVADLSGDRLGAVLEFATPLRLESYRFEELVKVIGGFDLVIGTLPEDPGFTSIRAAIKAGVDMVDVSLAPKIPLELREEAENAQVTVIFDAGFAPGLSHILMGRIWNELDDMSEGYVYFGDLPKEPKPPLYHGVGSSPRAFLMQYTRPARVIRKGVVGTIDPLSEVKTVEIEGLTLEAFPSDVLRSLLESVRVERLEGWELRWPGHLGKMKVLRELGFLEGEHLGKTLEVMTPLMVHEEYLSVMEVSGVEPEGRISYTLLGGPAWRVAGYTASAIARLVAEGSCIFGVIPPEILGMRMDNPRRLGREGNKAEEGGECFT